ncbi:MAG: ferredoxin family protein [Proteobacteria bacterium]|nr:ferredoxin family protein [Pseudomonadota bacterium]
MSKKKVIIDEQRCKGCQICIVQCKRGVLKLGNKINKLGYRYVEVNKIEDCTACGICAEMCPDVVIEVWKE